MISDEVKTELAAMTGDKLVAHLRTALINMSSTSNLASLADLAEYAGAIYSVIDWRGLKLEVSEL